MPDPPPLQDSILREATSIAGLVSFVFRAQSHENGTIPDLTKVKAADDATKRIRQFEEGAEEAECDDDDGDDDE